MTLRKGDWFHIKPEYANSWPGKKLHQRRMPLGPYIVHDPEQWGPMQPCFSATDLDGNVLMWTRSEPLAFKIDEIELLPFLASVNRNGE